MSYLRQKMPFEQMHASSIAAALLLAGVHIFAGALRFTAGPPRSVWLSVAGGTSAAYVALHLLPELQTTQAALEHLDGVFGAVEHVAYFAALVGIALFLGLDRLAATSASRREANGEGPGTSPAVFAVHIAFFALYNALLGNLMARGTAQALIPYAGALALHFTVNDAELREHHQELYQKFGRWILAASVLAGWVAGTGASELPPAIHLASAVVTGGVLLNIFKDEMPTNRQGRYWAMLAGVGFYFVLRWLAHLV